MREPSITSSSSCSTSTMNDDLAVINLAKTQPKDDNLTKNNLNNNDNIIKSLPSKRLRESALISRTKIKKLSGNMSESTSISTESREGSCEKNDCLLNKICCLNLSSNCLTTKESTFGAKNNFYHISKNEHICQTCYDKLSRNGRSMNEKYAEWKKCWIKESRCFPSIRLYIFDKFFPFWLKCFKCGKFRKVSHSSIKNNKKYEIIKKFTCNNVNLNDQWFFDNDEPHLTCDKLEDKNVTEAKNYLWINSLNVPPLLHNSPALYYLKNEYYYDEVGMSPLNDLSDNDFESFTTTFMSPFNIPNKQMIAFSLRPDVMEFDEIQKFPEYSIEQLIYLAMRNLIVTLWNLNPYKYLDYETCFSHLICPGLARVWYGEELKRVLEFLSMKNVINYGILDLTSSKKFLSEKVKNKQLDVIIVGGGISGLGAARQLKSFGAKVIVLEAKSKIGGRMQDDWSLGVCVGCGAQLITGIINNPIVLMCHQIGLNYRLLKDECPLLDSCTGRIVNPVSDRLVDEHFNCLLDAIGQWKHITKSIDFSLMEQIDCTSEKLIKSLSFRWTKEYERLLQWQIGNVEFSCGASLSKVSSRNWDQNEAIGQFSGSHALLADGSSQLIKRLAEGCDIRCSHTVTKIETLLKKIIVHCSNGKKFTCDKVIMCLPLAVYQKNLIEFIPNLPPKKILALKNLGAGLIEKVAVCFPRCFWTSLLKEDGTLDYFGNVPKKSNERSLFNMFYDFSTRSTNGTKKQKYVLMSYVCGDSVNIVNQNSDVEVVANFIETLQNLFPNEVIPNPSGYVVTHWGKDPYIGMSYSYVKVGGSGDDYDNLASTINNQVYFAGECTNRFYPQTMTGAYISSLREASKVAESWISENT